MSNSHDIRGVDDRTALVLNLWPPGTKGHADETRLIVTLNRLCKEFGYGRVPQVAAFLEDLWRNPERFDHYEAMRDEQLKFLAEYGPGGTKTEPR